jgi:hypothetical protein
MRLALKSRGRRSRRLLPPSLEKEQQPLPAEQRAAAAAAEETLRSRSEHGVDGGASEVLVRYVE